MSVPGTDAGTVDPSSRRRPLDALAGHLPEDGDGLLDADVPDAGESPSTGSCAHSPGSVPPSVIDESSRHSAAASTADSAVASSTPDGAKAARS